MSSVASIVLSVVAIAFAIWVNNRASEIDNQMIRSLQKIESTVERVSSDTRELITAGWNKMLGGIGPDDVADAADDSREAISGGLATEVRSELLADEGASPPASPDRLERIQRTLEDLQQTVAAQLGQRPIPSGKHIDLVLRRMSMLPIEARSILEVLASGRHIDRKEYVAAMKDPVLGDPLRSLRKAGLLVPLEGVGEDGDPVPVYHLPPGWVRRIRTALKLTGEIPDEIQSKVRATLSQHGYLPASHRA